MSRKTTHGLWIGVVLLVAALVVLAGPAGLVGAQAPTTTSDPESCATCHPNAGVKHQASYDELYQDGVIKVTDLKYSFKAPDESTVSFKMTKNGAPFDAKQADNLSIYFVPFSKGNFQFDPPAERLSLKGAKLTTDATGSVTTSVTKTVDYSKVDGLVVVYGRDDTLGTMPNSRVAQAKFPFAALLETGAGVDYVSVANNAGCEKCHSIPYLKHGYIYGQVGGDKGTDFYTCKACHLDNGAGGHFEWQLLVNDPPLAAKFLSASEEEAAKMLTDQQKKDMAYTTTTAHSTQHTAHSTQHTAQHQHRPAHSSTAHSTAHRPRHTAQHTAHSTQHTAHSTQHTAHSTQHTAHSTQHTHRPAHTQHSTQQHSTQAPHTQHTAHSAAQHTAHRTQHTQHTAHSTQHTAHSTQHSAAHSTGPRHTAHSTQHTSTQHTAQHTAHSTRSTAHSTQHTRTAHSTRKHTAHSTRTQHTNTAHHTDTITQPAHSTQHTAHHSTCGRSWDCHRRERSRNAQHALA